ncbi:hypothetical protein ACUY4R_000176 [Kosakonia sp. BK9b]
MNITLIRHGQPEITVLHSAKRIKANAMQAWIAGYDASDIVGAPTAEIISMAGQSDYCVCSPLRRAHASLLATGYTPDEIIHKLHEVPLAVVNVPFLRLRPQTWLIVFRLCWMLGFITGSESRSAARIRAGEAAEYLIKHAEEHGSVFSMGHGFMNRLLARELEKRGWKRADNKGHRYWSGVKYRHPLPQTPR